MGSKGQVPKRDSARRRNNSPQADTVSMIGDVEIPELDIEDPHPLVVDLYESLKVSGQAKWYEPSDWQRARVTCYLLSKQLNASRASSTMYATLQQDLGALLTCEGDRRRLRMEIDRDDQSVSEDDPRMALMDSYRKAG